MAHQYVAHPFPVGTLLANVLGCLLIGFFYAAAERGTIISPELLLLLTTGFRGGCSTVSTFSYETSALLSDGQPLYGACYVAGSLLLGPAATAADVWAVCFYK